MSIGGAPARTAWLTTKELFDLFRLLLRRNKDRADAVYDMLSTHNNLAEQSLYLNLGYWAEATTYDAACEALAEQLGLAAALGEGDEVLDVGFGFGDQDKYWLDRFSPARITGINLTQSQVTLAQQRFSDPRLLFQTGSATALPFDGGSFDKVMALESAFHFDTREAFMAEAFRVLRPGGVLALADVIPTAPETGLKARLTGYIGRSLWQTPAANMYGADVYRDKLASAGFEAVEVRGISEHVFAPFKAFARQRVQDAEVEARVNPLLLTMWAAPHEGFAKTDYIIATARRP